MPKKIIERLIPVGRSSLQVPLWAKVLAAVGTQGRDVAIYLQVDAPADHLETLNFVVYRTGDIVDLAADRHLASVVMPDGVHHVYLDQ